MVEDMAKAVAEQREGDEQDLKALEELQKSIDPRAWQALQSLGGSEALTVAQEVEAKRGLRNVSAFIVSRVQKIRLEALLGEWGEKLDERARSVLRSVPPRRAVEALLLLKAQKPVVRNPSAFVCSAAKGKVSWQEGGMWPNDPSGGMYFPPGGAGYGGSWGSAPWAGDPSAMQLPPYMPELGNPYAQAAAWAAAQTSAAMNSYAAAAAAWQMQAQAASAAYAAELDLDLGLGLSLPLKEKAATGSAHEAPRMITAAVGGSTERPRTRHVL